MRIKIWVGTGAGMLKWLLILFPVKIEAFILLLFLFMLSLVG